MQMNTQKLKFDILHRNKPTVRQRQWNHSSQLIFHVITQLSFRVLLGTKTTMTNVK